jgi:hypothetical protein
MLERYNAEQLVKTPFIDFDSKTGIFELKGKSIPENSVSFYKPLLEWLDNYCVSPNISTVLNFQLDYFNTSSAKIIADILKKLDKLQDSGLSNVVVNWYYQDIDEDMLEAGEDYMTFTKTVFNLISYTK